MVATTPIRQSQPGSKRNSSSSEGSTSKSMNHNSRQSYYYPSSNKSTKNGGKESVLSYILPVEEATKILGKETVRSVVHSMKHFYLHSSTDNSSSNNNSNINSPNINNHHLPNHEPYFRIDTRPSVHDADDEDDDDRELIPSTPVMGIDKAGALRSLLPPPVTPHAGVGGHLALMECVFYALARHQLKSIILLQDFIIFLAICQSSQTGKLAQLSFRIYDGFQKRGMITRDTLHRFLSDVHGEECHKRPNVRQVLDQMFAPPKKTAAGESSSKSDSGSTSVSHHQVPITHLSANQYITGIESTVDKENGSHILLDWLVVLGKNMLPQNGYHHPLSNSMQKLLTHKMDYADVIYPDGSIRALCQRYGLLMMENDDLYEMKRRYRSIVDQDNAPNNTACNKNTNSNNESEGEEDDSHHLPMDESEGQPKSSSSSSKMNTGTNDSSSKMKNVITETAFVKAVSSANEELGHGGYVTESLAQLIFLGGLNMRRMKHRPQHYWTMYDALSFGLSAVRGESLSNGKAQHARGKNAELPLLQFLYQAFLQLPKYSEENVPNVITTTEKDVDETFLMEHLDNQSDEKSDAQKMTRTQIAHMLLLLTEHLSFRLKSDSPDGVASVNSTTESPYSFIFFNGSLVTTATLSEEATMVEVSIASLLGLLPPGYTQHHSKATTVTLKSLVDYVLAHGSSSRHTGNEEKDLFSFQDFVNWYYAPPEHEGILSLIQRRIGPILLDLRLIASILFGIQPTLPSLEQTIVNEVERRHKSRYPQTDSSKRGPMGTTWYVIQSLWYKKWCAYAEISSPDTTQQLKSVGVINNNALLMDDGSLALRPGLRWKSDFELISPLAWSALQAWHDGGPPIHRSVVFYQKATETENVQPLYEIEMYPLFVTVLLSDSISRGEARPFQQYFPVSRFLPIENSLTRLCDSLEVAASDARLWFMGTCVPTSPNPDGSLYDEDEPTLFDLEKNIIEQLKEKGVSDEVLVTGNVTRRKAVICLELRDDKDGSWPMGQKHSRELALQIEDGQEKGENPMGDGIVGLYNMGNTCYLNSSIQCISHTPILRDYFTSKSYLNDINTTNPLGHQGRLAQVSAVLINSLWKKFNQSSLPTATRKPHSPGSCVPINAPSLTPKSFKEAIGRCNDLFAGNEQHDAQELLAFLLSGLSEDLNRIVDKPYIEAPDSDGRPDKELADIWWSNHLKREMSIIVALFTGQYKSLLTCRTCKYESARFEPFAFLQLPLPEDDQVSVQLVYFPITGNNEPMKYSIRVKQDGSLFDMLVSLARVLYTDKEDEAKFSSSMEIHSEGMSEITSGNEYAKSIQTSMNEDEKVDLNETDVSDKNGIDNAEDDKKLDDDSATSERSSSMNENEDDEEKEKIYAAMARNMGIVKMGDGYIFNIIPDSWSLSKLQNRDSGEIPLVYVYELDPLPSIKKGPEIEESKDNGEKGSEKEVTNDKPQSHNEANRKMSESSQNSVSEASKEPTDVKFSYLALMQRKLDLINRPLLHSYGQKVFGNPLLLRVVELEGYTGRDLYDLVAKRIVKFVPPEATRFLFSGVDKVSIVDQDIPENANPTGSSKRGGRQFRRKTTSDMEAASCGHLPRYGFRLRVVSRDGKKCSLCPWYDCCCGCLIPDDDSPTIALDGDSIALDWHVLVDLATDGFGSPTSEMDTLGNVQSRSIDNIKRHRTCQAGKNRYGYRGCISIEECLESFTKVERIPEAYCSRCREFRVQTKKMSVWRLPPVMIIHLKRFQFTQHMRRKLRDLVVFPTEGLDFSSIVAMDDSCPLIMRRIDSVGKIFKNKNLLPNGYSTDDEKVEATEPSPTAENVSSKTDDHNESLYDLYGVVHHQGALSGGHYVASLKSEIDGKWRLFNDAQIYEISDRDVVDASAYILFYIRRDAKHSSLEHFWDTRTREGEGMTEEEVEKMMKQRERCVIS